jgi:methyl-accepting chemotaxis protein
VDRWRRTLLEFVTYIPSGDTIPESTWRSRHRNILLLLAAHVPFLLALGLYEGTESTVTGATIPAIPTAQVLLEVGVVVALGALAVVPWLGRRTRTALATMGLVTTSGFLVHFSGGYIEAHFHFFVVMAVVAVYEDWLPFLLGIAYVSLQHGYFGMIEPSRVYNHSAAINNPWVWAFIHAAFVLGLAGALMAHWYSTERSREEAAEQLREAREKTAQIESLEEKKAEIERAKAEAEEAKAEAEARQAEVERLNERLETTANDYSAAMARAADGDLTVRLDADGESEAMVRIGEAFNEMMDETEAAMREIQTFARQVTAASEEAESGADSAEAASETVSQSVREIADGANEQREMLETVSAEITDLAATIEEVAASAETVAETSHQTAGIAESGEATAQDAIDAARTVQSSIDSTVDHVERLEERMIEIGDIVELIGDVAEQTNLLALNANIEAARAGGSGSKGGDGFAVVANEVKQLAEETQESANEIEGLIEETQTQTERTVEEAREAGRSMERGVEAVEDVADAFSQVVENVEQTDSGLQDISDTTDDQAASTEEAASMVEEVADISRATADESESASTAATEQASSISQVSTTVASLSERADQLRTLLSNFEVSDGGATPGSNAGPGGTVALEDGGRPE